MQRPGLGSGVPPTGKRRPMHSWIDTPTALANWIDARAMPQLIGLDTEFMRTNTFTPRLALVQLCVDGHIALLDTPIAAAMAGLGFGLSYQKLVALLIGVDVPKGETRSDWLLRPLSAAQLEYAAQDVVWLPKLHEILAEKLAALGRTAWLAEDCRTLIERANTQPDPEPQRAMRGAADWPIERQALLRRLLRWRDARARTLDKPKPWILDDAHALQLASQPPRDASELFERTKGLRALEQFG